VTIIDIQPRGGSIDKEHNRAAIRGERHVLCADRERPSLGAGGQVPQVDLGVDRRSKGSVGREVGIRHVVGGARKGADDLAAVHLDEARIAVTRPSQQEAAIGRDREAIHPLGRGDDAVTELMSGRPLQRGVGLGRVLRLDPADRQQGGQLGALTALEDAIGLRPQPLAVGVGETVARLLAERHRHDAERRGESQRPGEGDRPPAQPAGRGGCLFGPAPLGVRQPLGRLQLAPVLLLSLDILAPRQHIGFGDERHLSIVERVGVRGGPIQRASQSRASVERTWISLHGLPLVGGLGDLPVHP
jgi:hypothetical protein